MDHDESVHSVCVAVDIEGYGKRLESEQGPLQEALCRIMNAAGTRAALAVDRWNVQKQGDGQLILAPLDSSEHRYVDELPRQLAAELARHNRNLVEDARIRMRLALHQGVAYPGANGFVGEAAVLVCRLLDAQVCRDALQAGHADLVLILSESLYTDNVLAERTALRPSDLAQVAVRESKVDTTAWIWSPDGAVVESLKLARSRKESRAGNGRPPMVQKAQTITNIKEIEKIDFAHFGTRIERGGDDDD